MVHENVQCIFHTSVSGIVPAIVPDIPELAATVAELVLQMVHCNCTPMSLAPRVKKMSHFVQSYSIILSKTTNFHLSRLHRNSFYNISSCCEVGRKIKYSCPTRWEIKAHCFSSPWPLKLSQALRRPERKEKITGKMSSTKHWADQTASIFPQGSLVSHIVDCHVGPKPHTSILSLVPAQSQTISV